MTRLSRFLKLELTSNSLKTKITYILFKDLDRTSQYTISVSLIKTDKLPLYRKIGFLLSEIHTKHISTL